MHLSKEDFFVGNYVNVDLDKLKAAKSALSAYEKQRKTIISQLNSAVNTELGWIGDDRTSFDMKWNSMFAADGFLNIAGESIAGYRNLISKAYELYKKAQSEAVEQASKIK